MTRGWYVGWSTFVGISWLLLAAALADDETCTWICFTFGDMLFILLIPAATAWAVGLLVLYVVGRVRRKRTSPIVYDR
jgi:hypothetical protein